MTIQARSTLSAAIDTSGGGGTTGQEVRNIVDSAFIRQVATYTASTPTIDDDDTIVLLDGTSNTVTAALPDASTSAHRILFVKAINIDNAVALDPGTDTLEGSTNDYVFTTANDAIIVACDGAGWFILSEYLNA